MLREGQGKAKARSRRDLGKVKVRSGQRKHNLNRNYNLIGFDTIKINLFSAVSDLILTLAVPHSAFQMILDKTRLISIVSKPIKL